MAGQIVYGGGTPGTIGQGPDIFGQIGGFLQGINPFNPYNNTASAQETPLFNQTNNQQANPFVTPTSQGYVYNPPTTPTQNTSGTQPQNTGGGGNQGGNQPQNTGGPQPDTELQQLQKIGNDMNPAQRARYQQLTSQQQPQQPQINFDALIAPAIQGYENFINTITGTTQNQIGSLEQQRGTLGQNGAIGTGQLGQAQEAQREQENTLNRASTAQQESTGNAIEDAKRMFAEMSQGIQSRFGGTTGTGGFANELLGQSTGRNIANLQRGLQQNLQDITDKMTQVQHLGQLAIQGVNDKFDTAIQQSRDNLQNQIANIKAQEGTLQMHKAELAAHAIESYQNFVNGLQAQREQQANQYAIAALNAQTQLETYRGKLSSLQPMAQQNTGVTPMNPLGMGKLNVQGGTGIGTGVGTNGQQGAVDASMLPNFWKFAQQADRGSIRPQDLAGANG